MHITLHMSWLAIDGTAPTTHCVRVPAGTYEVERIQNPILSNGSTWIVLKGTKIGASEAFWHSWAGTAWGDFEVQVAD